MKMKAIVPLKGFDYPPGTSRKPGVSFLAPERDAKILVLIRKAQWDPAVAPESTPDQPKDLIERRPIDVIADVLASERKAEEPAIDSSSVTASATAAEPGSDDSSDAAGTTAEHQPGIGSGPAPQEPTSATMSRKKPKRSKQELGVFE